MPETSRTGPPALGPAAGAVHGLYARVGALDLAVADFVPWALGELRRRVRCDLALATTVDRASGAATALRRCRPADPDGDALLRHARDAAVLRRQALDAPGRAVRTAAGGDGTGAHAVLIVATDSDHGLAREVALWRWAGREPFTRAEADWLEFVVPHVFLSARMHLTAVGRRRGRPGADAGESWFALCDSEGTFLEAEEGFLMELGTEGSERPPSRLPPALRAVLGDGAAADVVGERIAIHRLEAGPASLLQMRRRVAADRLSPAQRLIVDHLAAGRSHRAVAALLAIGTTTVRNHTAAIYRRLGVRNRAQLLRAVRSSRDAPRDEAALADAAPTPAGAVALPRSRASRARARRHLEPGSGASGS